MRPKNCHFARHEYRLLTGNEPGMNSLFSPASIRLSLFAWALGWRVALC